MKKNLNLTNTMEFPPLMSEAEIKAIIKVIRENRPKIIVELGCYSGGTTIKMSEFVPTDAMIYAVDIFAINGKDIRDFVINERFPKYENITLIEKTTHEASQGFNQEIDFLFVDADHQDDSIQQDCHDWLPKLKSGGIVVFDDYANDDFPAVGRRVQELTSGWETIAEVETIIIKRKP